MASLKYIFGPVPSRRLGRSLGVNVVPSKICSMNCVYCEVGKTKALSILRKPYIKAKDILGEFEENYETLAPNIDVITITGAGEPTLNSELASILKGIKSLSDKPVAILTNSTMFYDKEVFDTLLDFDIVVPSLDAAREESFKKVTLVHENLGLADIVKNLERFSNEYKGKLFLEVLLCGGLNDSADDVEALGRTIKNIRVDKAQLGTIVRPPAFSDAYPVSDEKILEAAKYFISLGIPAEATGSFKEVYKNTGGAEDLKSLIKAISRMRPCTAEDFAAVFGAERNEVKKVLEELLKEGLLVSKEFEGHIYYNHPLIDALNQKSGK